MIIKGLKDAGKYLVYDQEKFTDFETIESELRSQVREYITELESINYTLQVNFYEDPERYQEYMEINFQIADYEVYAVVT